jgi:hypothetical protein
MSIAEKVIEEFEKDIRLRKKFAELFITEPDIRLVLINAVIAEVATKRDINELRSEFRNEINQLRSEINRLRNDIWSNFKWTIGVIITVWGASIIPILLKIAGII